MNRPLSPPRCKHNNWPTDCQKCRNEYKTAKQETSQFVDDALSRVFDNDDGIKSTMKHALARAYLAGQNSVTQK